MAKIEDLINQVADTDLRSSLKEEVSELKRHKDFGLVFEEHIPEVLRMPTLPVRAGTTVARHEADSDEHFWTVSRVEEGTAYCSRQINGNREREEFSVEDLVVIKRLGDPIFPGLRPVASVERSQERPRHLILQADNYHALQLLQYTHEAELDLIYIDPPYNTGATEWKYNNNYVDEDDAWRHSKWLSMMKKRLQLAKTLLTDDGVFVCAIDENEHANLVLLLEEVFPNHEITSVVVEHNPRGVQGDNFSYTHELAVFVIPRGVKAIARRRLPKEERQSSQFRNWGGESRREDAQNCFYPIFVEDGEIVGFGDVAPDDYHPSGVNEELDDGRVAVWPIDTKEVERKWRYARQSVEDIVDRLSTKKVRGEWQVYITKKSGKYRTVWTGPKYDASSHGSQVVKKTLGESFPFPKSLYTMEEILYACTANKPDAKILDYFGGSGTTLHATMLLNSKDDGERQCLLVTNNELDPKTERKLKRKGLKPGDPEWEKHGICESVTWPRCRYAAQGERGGEPLPGEYKNGRPMSEGFEANIDYLKLEFLDPDDVALGRAFEAILPILWMASGADGSLPSPDELPYMVPGNCGFAVLRDEEAFQDFRAAISDRDDLNIVFIVTDAEDSFREMANDLPVDCPSYQLYKNYLHNFRLYTHWHQ